MRGHVSSKEAAKILGISQSTLLKMAKKGDIKAEQRGNRYYYKENDLYERDSAITMLAKKIDELIELVKKQ